MAINPVPTQVVLPAAPDRNTQQGNTFSNAARTWSFALPSWGDWLDSVGSNVFNNATETEGFATTASAAAVTAANQATIATEQAAIATAEALSAANSASAAAEDFTATSTTSVTIGTGTKSFAIETGKALIAGQSVRIVSDSNISNYMMGQISTAIDGNIWVSVTTVGGSGTFADWSISLVNLSPSDFKTVGGQSIIGVGNIDTLVIGYQEFSSSGTCTIPSGASYAYVQMIAGGGSGSCGGADTGGGAGEGLDVLIPVSSLSASETVIIGSGGPSVNGSNLQGNNGGDTVFASFTARGGKGGGSIEDAINGACGNGSLSVYSQSTSRVGSNGSGGRNANGGDSRYAGGGGGTANGLGGSGNIFGDGGDGASTGAAQSGGIGAGGGASEIGFASGAGGDGFLRIWFW